MIGPEIRDRGSLHSDVWTGTAQELVDKEFLAIVPIKGWWADNPSKQTEGVRYSLIVTIETADLNNDIDLYTEIVSVIQSRLDVKARTDVELEGFVETDDWMDE